MQTAIIIIIIIIYESASLVPVQPQSALSSTQPWLHQKLSFVIPTAKLLKYDQ